MSGCHGYNDVPYIPYRTERSEEETEEIENLLESYSMQLEDMLSKTVQLKQLIERAENIILINLDRYCNFLIAVTAYKLKI